MGEDPEVRIDEWLPSLEQAHDWNDWTEEELLLQLAGHLRSRALEDKPTKSHESVSCVIDPVTLRVSAG